MASLDLKAEINDCFSQYVCGNEKLFDECASLCHIYNILPQDLLFKWEALNYTAKSSNVPSPQMTMHDIASLRAILQQDLVRETKHSQLRTTAKTTTALVDRMRLPHAFTRGKHMVQGSVQVKMEQSLGSPGSNPATHGIAFRGPAMGEASGKNCSYRYMYEKISERSEALDDKIDEFGEIVRHQYNISDLGDPSSSSSDEMTVVGRIVHDSDSQGATQLTETTMALESSRMQSAGVRVPLRFDPNLKIRGGSQGNSVIGFFPGAVAAFRGTNGGGGKFLVTEILSLPLPKISLSAGLTSVDGPFKMDIACGPYTLDSDLAYQPWRSFLKHAEESKPTVLLLIGPFIDAHHPRIKEGDVDTTPEEFFKLHFFEPLQAYLDMVPGGIALLIPSPRDLISDQAVFPQGELKLSYKDARIIPLPNPCNFSINNISFSVSSVDTLYHIKKEEYVKRGIEIDSVASSEAAKDTLTNLCRHILQQRSFYPLFPPPLDVSHEVNLSVTRLDGLKLGDEAPDVLVSPSRLKQFFKIVDSTAALNPGFMAKGSYATLNVAAPDMHGQRKIGRISAEITRV